MITLSERDLFVAYSMPGETGIQLQLHEENLPKNSAFQFVIHPFIRHSIPTTFIRSSKILHEAKFSFSTNQPSNIRETREEDYFESADKLLQSIAQKECSKIVLSRLKKQKNQQQNYVALFQSLVAQYPKTFCYFFNIPGRGSWIGASPEILLESTDNGFQTVALAGTQAAIIDDPTQVVWGDKEKEEQQIIVDYVSEKLRDRQIEYKLKGPYSSRAGQMYHLKSVFESSTVIDPVELALALHPGPAISGYPVEKALDFITQNESHDRAYYCGFLGPVSDTETSLFINLRCMQVFSDAVYLYIGGGFTKDSSVQAEWDETELKSRTLLNVVEQVYSE